MTPVRVATAVLAATLAGVGLWALVSDSDLGGNASDPFIFGVLALVFAVLASARWKGQGDHRLT